MKQIKNKMLAIALFVAGTSVSFGQSTWNVDKSHSTVKFTVTHLVISEVEGNFKMFDGKIESKRDDFEDSRITFDVVVASINTDNEMRDTHLKGDDFFNAGKYPQMTFVGTSFKKKTGNKYTLEGKLTIRDVTRDVEFDVTLGGVRKDPYGNTKAGFSASTTINRQQFGLKWTGKTESGDLVVSDDVLITLKLEFSKQQ